LFATWLSWFDTEEGLKEGMERKDRVSHGATLPTECSMVIWRLFPISYS